jgi:hypothetical protein
VFILQYTKTKTKPSTFCNQCQEVLHHNIVTDGLTAVFMEDKGLQIAQIHPTHIVYVITISNGSFFHLALSISTSSPPFDVCFLADCHSDWGQMESQ